MAAMAAAAPGGASEAPRLLPRWPMQAARVGGIPETGRVAQSFLEGTGYPQRFLTRPLAGLPAAARSLLRPRTHDGTAGWAVRKDHCAGAEARTPQRPIGARAGTLRRPAAARRPAVADSRFSSRFLTEVSLVTPSLLTLQSRCRISQS